MSPITKHIRWAAWEHAVLNKADNPKKCQQVILKRQQDVDDDQDEADLVAAEIRLRLRRVGRNPDTSCVFIRGSLLAEWVSEATGERMPATKVTPYLRTLDIPELERRPRKSSGAGWVWRGPNAGKRPPEDYDALAVDDDGFL